MNSGIAVKWRLAGVCLAALAGGGTALCSSIAFTPSTPSVVPGGSFTVDVYGTSVNVIGGYSLFLNSSATGSQIQIASQALNTTDFTYGGPSPTFPQAISSTQKSQDLGAFSTSDLPANTQYLLGTETILVAAGTPAGNYVIGNTADTVFANPSFTQGDYAAVSSFTINVVPEPASLGLVCVGGMLMLRRQRRDILRDITGLDRGTARDAGGPA